jgi:hypothetical protein
MRQDPGDLVCSPSWLTSRGESAGAAGLGHNLGERSGRRFTAVGMDLAANVPSPNCSRVSYPTRTPAPRRSGHRFGLR